MVHPPPIWPSEGAPCIAPASSSRTTSAPPTCSAKRGAPRRSSRPPLRSCARRAGPISTMWGGDAKRQYTASIAILDHPQRLAARFPRAGRRRRRHLRSARRAAQLRPLRSARRYPPGIRAHGARHVGGSDQRTPRLLGHPHPQHAHQLQPHATAGQRAAGPHWRHRHLLPGPTWRQGVRALPDAPKRRRRASGERAVQLRSGQRVRAALVKADRERNNDCGDRRAVLELREKYTQAGIWDRLNQDGAGSPAVEVSGAAAVA